MGRSLPLHARDHLPGGSDPIITTTAVVSPTQISILGCRVKWYDGTVPSGQVIPNATFTALTYNTNIFDTGGFHPITADSNLTGTVSKTSGSATITGSSTAFLSELSVGDPVRIPGGATYYPDIAVVRSIETNTSFTAYQEMQQSASGQTAVLDASAFVVPPGLSGYYDLMAGVYYRGDNDGYRELFLIIDGIDGGNDTLLGTNSHQEASWFGPPVASPAETASTTSSGAIYLQEGQYWQWFAYQTSGGDLQTAADYPGTPAAAIYLGSAGAIPGVTPNEGDWHTGSGVPNGTVGVDGDFYLRYNGDVYGPKAAGAWGSVLFSLAGATGSDGAAGSSVLAYQAYAPGTDTTIGTTTSASQTDVDATNLAVTFTAPASGKVLIRLTGMADQSAANVVYWGVRETTTLLGEGWMYSVAGNTSRYTFALAVTGLTPSSSHTYKWSYRTTGGTARVYGGPAYGTAVMEVHALP